MSAAHSAPSSGDTHENIATGTGQSGRHHRILAEGQQRQYPFGAEQVVVVDGFLGRADSVAQVRGAQARGSQEGERLQGRVVQAALRNRSGVASCIRVWR